MVLEGGMFNFHNNVHLSALIIWTYKQKRAEYDKINGYNQKKEEPKTSKINEESAKTTCIVFI